MRNTVRTRALAEAIAGSFEEAGFSPASLLCGPITITDLPWQAPPLRSKDTLLNVAISEYLDYPKGLDAEEMFFAYSATIDALRNDPGLVVEGDCYNWLRKALPRASDGERRMLFPLPDGWPAHEHTAVAVFALEAVHAFVTSSAQCSSLIDNDDSFCVTTPWGPVGVYRGAVCGLPEETEINYKGFIQGMLETPRGPLTTTCSYDLIARVRSALHEQPDAFREFAGTDHALQALRILYRGENCAELQHAIENMSALGFKRKARATAFREAIAVMESWAHTDRAKISMLLEILVPTYISLTTFSYKILDPRKVLPSVLSTAVERRILAYLRRELEKAELRAKR